MSVHLNLNLVHPFFREPLRVGVKWTFPFLPRVGESINPWIWIEEKEITREELEKRLSSDGKRSLEEEDFSGEVTLNDWLYEVGIGCDIIYSIGYYKNDEVDPHEICVEMYLTEDGKRPKY